MTNNIIQELNWRGVIKQMVHVDLISQFPAGTGVYCGIDPTMPSLQIGNLLQLITLVRFQQFGFKIIVVVGSATAQIGDPSGKSKVRNQLTTNQIKINAQKIRKQIAQIFPQIKVVIDNNQWLSSVSWVSFVYVVARHFNVAQLLTYDNIKQRLAHGLTMAEFSYALVQAYDFFWVFNKYNCHLQIGGSDQWTNITSGINYVQKRCGPGLELAGLTTNLVVDSQGIKLGKTNDNAIFVDPALTPQYNFFNFFYNQPDRMVNVYLKFFTFVTPQQLQTLTDQASEHKRIKQHWLARELFTMVYGETAWKKMQAIQTLLFKTPINQLRLVDCQLIAQHVPHHAVRPGENLVQVCRQLKICQSHNELKKLITKQAISVNHQPLNKWSPALTNVKPLFRHYWLIKRGKQQFFMVTMNVKSADN